LGGVPTKDNTLSWNNNIDKLMKKLSMACYLIGNAVTYMPVLSLKMIYLRFLHSPEIFLFILCTISLIQTYVHVYRQHKMTACNMN
jgi:uncharacterized membrane protein YecN with MAPEG domain